MAERIQVLVLQPFRMLHCPSVGPPGLEDNVTALSCSARHPLPHALELVLELGPAVRISANCYACRKRVAKGILFHHLPLQQHGSFQEAGDACVGFLVLVQAPLDSILRPSRDCGAWQSDAMPSRFDFARDLGVSLDGLRLFA